MLFGCFYWIKIKNFENRNYPESKLNIVDKVFLKLELFINKSLSSQTRYKYVKFDKVRQTFKGSKVIKLAENYKKINWL